MLTNRQVCYYTVNRCHKATIFVYHGIHYVRGIETLAIKQQFTMQKNQLPDDWTIDEVWNPGLILRRERPRTPRDYLWASELGKSLVDIFLNLKGTEPSNKPDERALRKMEAGNYFEYLIKLVMMRAGILQESQERIEYQAPGLMKVTGRLDFIGGGMPNLEEAEKMLAEESMPESMRNSTHAVVTYLLEKYPEGLASKVVEVKSLALISFEKVLRDQKPIESHVLQLAPYILKKEIPGMLCYICRDDMRIMSFNVYAHHVEEALHTRIKFFMDMLAKDEQPAIEPLIIFNELEGKFTFNFNVRYSNYLTMLYSNPITKEPFGHPEEYAEYVKKVAGRWNRVLGRVKKKQDMTKDNLVALQEIRDTGFDADKIVDSFQEETTDEGE